MRWYISSFTRFLALPPELRNQIYASHFRTLTLVYPTFTPPPLLFTSHQIHTEALPLLQKNATYNLLTTEHFVDYLTTLTPASLAQLRHISVRGVPFPVYPDDDDTRYHTHLFPSLLPLFPGLHLDTLEVIDAFHGKGVDEDGWGHEATYYHLEAMIKKGKGWKELVFKSVSDRWLKAPTYEIYGVHGTGATTKTNGLCAQPRVWDRVIKERDGEDSGARVEMWSCGEEGVWEKVEGDYNAEVEDETEQDELEDEAQGDSTEDETDQDDTEDDSEPDSPDEYEGPLLSMGREGDDDSRPSIEVRVRRGEGAQYVQDRRSIDESDSSRKLREMFEKLGWKEIKARGLFIPRAENRPCSHL
ncbi:MAG: hypothetical protein ASARMPRED_000602 [Alectoria sarmentosa]|nr:MAG: hypothetical protein ASARMPRED_000602 [Alectoria sarmentosa]